MSIVTKTGDRGTTSLAFGRKVAKDHIAIECCGTLDELGSCLGMAKSLIRKSKTRELIESIQRDLFMICAEVSTGPKQAARLSSRLDKSYVARIEKAIEAIEKKCPSEVRSFTVAGRNAPSASMDLARTIARRAERRIVTLKNRAMLKNRHILIYLNRLSDLLYLLARCLEKKSK